jgi:hypothetical protein
MNTKKINTINKLNSYDKNQLKYNNNDMKQLANDIAMNLPETSKLMNEPDFDDIDDDEDNIEYLIIPDTLKDPLIIIISYIILSQNFVQKSIARYLSIIKPKEDGTFSQISIIIYGTIIAILYSLIKKIIS